MTKPYNGGKPVFEEFITPIGVFLHMFHDKPQLKTTDQLGKVPDLDENGIQRAEYKVTVGWDKNKVHELNPMIELAQRVKHTAWPESAAPGAFFALQTFFRDGDNPEHNTKQKEYLLGKYYLNFKQKADAARDPHNTNIIHYTGAPGLLGPNKEQIMPIDAYPGCTGRVSGIMFATEYMGKHFISTRLNNIQLFETPDTNPALERIGGGGRPSAESQFDEIGGGTPATVSNGMFGL